MKKLIYISQSLLTGTSANNVHVVNMCDALSRLFDDVELIHAVAGQDSRAISELLSVHYGVSNTFRTRPVTWYKVKGMAIIYSFIVLLKIWKEAGKNDLLIFSRCLYSAFLVSIFKIRVSIIYETHALPRTWLHQLLERVILRSPRVVKFVLITQALRRSYEERYPNAEFIKKIFVAPDGAPARLLSEVSFPIDDFAPSQRYIVYTGSLLPGKGVDLVIEIAQKMPQLNFVVVGGKPEEVNRIKLLGIQNLILTGFVSPKEVNRYQRNADVLLLPNQTSVLCDGGRVDIGAWTSPLKLFEYMAAGKPIVASDLGVLKEVLLDGSNCLLATASDSDAWVVCIQRLLADRKFAEELSNNALIEFKEKYTWDARATLIVDSLRSSNAA